MRLFSSRQETPEVNSPVLSILDRLWQTKMQSIGLIEFWAASSKEADIRSGLNMQLEDERRHLRLVGEEIKRLGGRVSTERREGTVARAFGLVRAQKRDLHRLCAYYRGIKLITHTRCNQLVQVVEPATAVLMNQIAHDEERHVRWADIRIAHLMKASDMRECHLLVDRTEAVVDSSWQKLWMDLVHTRLRRTAAS